MIEALVEAEIPVMGHLGLTPQSVNAMGGYRVQGRDDDAAQALVADAKAIVAGRVLRRGARGGPRDRSGAAITEALDVPTIGIGAGPDCDGQVLVFHDLLGLQRAGAQVRPRATPTSERRPPPRWPPTPPTCVRAPSPPTPRSTTDPPVGPRPGRCPNAGRVDRS